MNDNGNIKLELADWLYNAGLVGFINIIENSGYNVNFIGKEIYFNINVLNDFEIKYFKYFIDTYQNFFNWYKVVNFESFIEEVEGNKFCNFNLEKLEILNNFIGIDSKAGTLKYILNSNSYKSAYKLINENFNILKLEKTINKIKIKKNEEIKDKITEIKELLEKIKLIINYFNKENSKKYLIGKDIIYNILNLVIGNVSFLNPQTKIKDFYIDFRNYFVLPVIDYLESNKINYKHNCYICGRKIKNLNDSLSFLNEVGFDVARKNSNVWNFINDIAICPICKLIYSCVPAGFTYINKKGIFINDNHQVENIKKINSRIKIELINNKKNYSMLKSISESFKIIMKENLKYELADIQLVRFENGTYHFNLLSKNFLKMLDKLHNSGKIKILSGIGFVENDIYFNLYDEVIKRIINNENLYQLIHKLLILKISKPQNVKFNVKNINDLLYINYDFINLLKGVKDMENLENYEDNNKLDVLKLAKSAGYYLRESYKQKNSENKIIGISYRLLNALKTNNKYLFMDIILSCYLYTEKTIPSFFIKVFKNDNIFKNIGYSFITGFIEGTNSDYNYNTLEED